MHEPISVPPVQPSTAERTRRRKKTNGGWRSRPLHPEVGFSPAAALRGPRERWMAYWWLAEEGRAWHVTGPTLADVLDTLAEEFGTDRVAHDPPYSPSELVCLTLLVGPLPP